MPDEEKVFAAQGRRTQGLALRRERRPCRARRPPLHPIPTARLHGLDPEAYLRDVLRVLAHWPHQRYLELAPKYWAATRARLLPAELDAEVGELTVPAPVAASPKEQASPR
ncbi:transposase domain-containing protein [Corallococcus macrosporus]|uniref:transposase domain-containing protein n=1 Tax=Corallococcus macrosporus TaxID=35 RepID=UPI001EFE3662|nr:transposase domain-containing protein [Corallococcus macrosporus]